MQVIKLTIHNNCKSSLGLEDFNRNQQVLEMLKTFILDYSNIQTFRAVIEDKVPESVFVLYSLLQKCLLNSDPFINQPYKSQSQDYFYNEYDGKLNTTQICNEHINIAAQYLISQQGHPTYVINQVVFTIALMLRKFWLDINKVDDLVQTLLKNTFQTVIGLKLFGDLLTCIRQYTYAVGYIEFRKVMANFSNTTLMRILQEAHGQLKLLNGRTLVELYKQDKPMCEAYINLLNQLISLNFNMNYYDLDSELDGKDTSQLTNFPDYYLQFITDQIFLKEMFQCSIYFLTIDSGISLICIQMLQRISCVRLSIFHGKKCKGAFRNNMWEGLQFIFQNQDHFNQSQEIIPEIYSLAIRIINNLTLRKLSKFKKVFDAWTNNLERHSNTLLQLGFRIIPNNPFTKLQEVWNQVAYQIQLHCPLQSQEVWQINAYKQNYFINVIKQFYRGPSFTEIPQDCSVKKYCKLINLTFLPFQCAYKAKLQDNVTIMYQMMSQLNQNSVEQCSALICLIQTFLLHTTATSDLNLGFIDSFYNQFGEEPKQNLEGQSALMKFVIDLVSNQQIQQKSKIFEMSLLSFLETFLNLTLDSIQYDQQTNQIKNISNVGKLVELYNYLDILEKILEECFQIFTCQDPQLIEFSLKLIEQIYYKVKKHLPRRVFRNCSITNMLKQFFLQLEITCLNQPQYIKKRALIFKIISIVWVDDYSDDYISAMVEIYRQIKQNIQQEMNKINMLKYLWDLIGFASEITIDNIYRTFLRIIYPDLCQLFIQDNIEIFTKDYDSSIAILTFLRILFDNKNARLNSENIQLILYQIYGKAIHFFNIFCKQQLEIAQPTDNQIKLTSKLLQVMSEISASKQINSGFFIIFNDLGFLSLFKNQLLLIKYYRPLLHNIPKYKKILMECFENICSEHPETLAYKCEVDIYLEIFSICYEILSCILKDNKGEEQINENCSTLILIGNQLTNISCFLIQEALIGHPSDLQGIKQKIQNIIQQGRQLLEGIFNTSWQITCAYPKNSKITFAIPELLYAISIFSPVDFQQYLIQIITNQYGLNAVNKIMDVISGAFSNLNQEMNTTSKDDFTRKIKTILECYK